MTETAGPSRMLTPPAIARSAALQRQHAVQLTAGRTGGALLMPVTIRSRLLMLVLSVLLPGLLGVVWMIGRTFENERLANERTLRETARALSLVVDRHLAERATIARTLAGSRWLEQAPDLTPDQVASFAGLAHRALADVDGWVELRARGRVLLDTRSPTDTAEQRREAGAPASAELANAPSVESLEASDSKDAHAAVIQPVQRNGETLLNVVVTLRAAELQRIIDAQSLPEGWVGTVLDNRGIVVARHPNGHALAGRAATGDLKQLLASGSEAFFSSRSLEGVPMVGYFRTAGRGWTYVAAMPENQFAGYLPQAAVQILLAAAALLALAVGGAFLVSRRIVAPVRSLRDIAARMQAGETVPHSRTGIAEFDDVATVLAQAANAFQDHRHELERQVTEAVERTRQAEQRASQSQRIEALGRLTGGVAHDFNNLLGVISNSAHLIQRYADSPELKAPVAATLRAVEAGSRLTQHLLRVAGRRPLSPERVHLDSHLSELPELLHSVLGRRIEVSVRVAPGTWPVSVDTSELELALINLALNARDAMSTGGELQVRARNAEDHETAGLPNASARHYVLIAVTDDGVGMEADVAQHAFEPFFTTKELGKGTGLGLSQVMGFCTQAGGTARLDSTPGLGTTVSLLLPAAVGTALATVGTTAGADVDLVGMRILVVDDNHELARVTAALLQSDGAQVERAQNAAEALFLLAIQPDFDIVLTDVMMPGELDGVGLARRLRSERPNLPVVLISGYKADITPGEFVLLAKPTAPNELLCALRDALMASRLTAQEAEPGRTH